MTSLAKKSAAEDFSENLSMRILPFPPFLSLLFFFPRSRTRGVRQLPRGVTGDTEPDGAVTVPVPPLPHPLIAACAALARCRAPQRAVTLLLLCASRPALLLRKRHRLG